MNSKGGRRVSEPYSDTANNHLNLFYCHSCGYNVDHDEWSFPYKKEGHVTNMVRDESHEYYGANMKAQHNCLSDGSGIGKGYEIYLNQQ